MLTLEQALTLVRNTNPDVDVDESRVTDRGAYWHFPVATIGSLGVLVDKNDGTTTPMSSVFKLETWLAAYEAGFRSETCRLVVTEIVDVGATATLLEKIGLRDPGAHSYPKQRFWEGERLRTHLKKGAGPVVFENQDLWLSYPQLVQIKKQKFPFTYRVEKDDERARRATTRLAFDAPSFRAVAQFPDLVLMLQTVIDARALEVVLTERLHTLACWGMPDTPQRRRKATDPVHRERRRLAALRETVPCRIVPPPRERPSFIEVEPDARAELVELVVSSDVNLVVTDDGAVEAALPCDTLSLEKLESFLISITKI